MRRALEKVPPRDHLKLMLQPVSAFSLAGAKPVSLRLPTPVPSVRASLLVDHKLLFLWNLFSNYAGRPIGSCCRPFETPWPISRICDALCATCIECIFGRHHGVSVEQRAVFQNGRIGESVGGPFARRTWLHRLVLGGKRFGNAKPSALCAAHAVRRQQAGRTFSDDPHVGVLPQDFTHIYIQTAKISAAHQR
jgi:hypothetical protein